MSGLGEVFIGASTSFTVSFDNTHPTDTGFGPFIDLYFPVNGADGSAGTATPDGLDFVSATYLGQAVTATVLTFPAAPLGTPPCGPGQSQVTHPYAEDLTRSPIVVCGTPGDKLVVLQLPFGSFAPDQPPAAVTVNAQLSNLADLGTPLTVYARGGFQFGNDPLNNPCCDPTVFTDPTPSTILDVPTTGAVTPTLVTLSKSNDAHESETATGPNYPVTYTVSLEVAPGQTLNNVTVTDTLDNNIVVTGISAPGASVVNPVAPPNFGPVNGGQVSVTYPSVSGTRSFDITFYVNNLDANGSPVLPPSSGDDNDTENRVNAVAQWSPLDGRDPNPTPVNIAGTCPTCPPNPDNVLADKSIAVQKTVVTVPATNPLDVRAGTTLRYTLEFQISDYFTFGDLQIDDILSDGQRFDPAFTPTFSIGDRVDNRGGTFNLTSVMTPTTCAAAAGGGFNMVVDTSEIGNDANPATDGSTHLTFCVSQALLDAGALDGILQGGYTQGFTSTAATGTITYQTRVQNDFSDTYPSGDPSVDHGDVLNNAVTISGSVRDNNTITTTLGTEPDTSGTELIVRQGALTKTIFAINGAAPSGSPPEIRPGDLVTYRLQYEMPSSDFEDFSVNDYLPQPIFDATTITTFNPTVAAGPADSPPAGTARFGPNDDLFAVSGIVPVIRAVGVNNSVTFCYGVYPNGAPDLTCVGEFDADDNLDRTIDIVFTVQVSAEPFADGLFLTNQAHTSEGSTNSTGHQTDSIIQVRLREPILQIKKGITDSTNTGQVFTPTSTAPAGVTMTGAGSAPPGFTGTISAANNNDTVLNSDVAGVDAGDTIRFVITVQNTGGHGAYDIVIRDTLPGAGFVIPATMTDFHFDVRLGDGTPLSFTSPAGAFPANDPRNLFTSGIELVDPAAGACQQANVAPGRDIVVITYDLQIDNAVSAGTILTNTASITQYSGQDGTGATNNHVDPADTTGQFSDDANTTISGQPQKTVVGTSEAHTTGLNVVIGEIVRYRLVYRVPEGTTTNLVFRDDIPAGMQFLNDNSARFALVSDTGLASSNGSITAAGGNVAGSTIVTPTAIFPSGNISGGTGDGVDVSFTFGTLTNNDRDATDEYVVLELNALVLNAAGNQQTPATTFTNSFTVVINGTDSQSTTSTDVPTVVEPTLTLTKSAPSVLTGDAHDTFTYTLTVQNTSTTTAYEVRVTDTVSPDLIVTGVTVVPNTGVTNNTVGNAVDLLIASVNPASAVTITLNVEAAVSIQPGQPINNAANVTYTSLPGTGTPDGQPGNSTGSTTPGASGAGNGERGGGGGVNDYTVTANSPQAFTMTNLVPVKSIVETSEAHTTGTNVAIGEIVRYRLAVQVPEGTMNNFTVVDTFSLGVRFQDVTQVRMAFVRAAGSTDITSSVLSAADNTTANTTSTASPLPLVLPAGNITQAGQNVTFNLGTVVNDNNNNGSAEFVIIEFNALVDNSVNTNINDVLANRFSVSTGAGPTLVTRNSNTVNVTVQEPQLAIVKSFVGVPPIDADDPVTYTLVVTADSSLNRTTAFEVRVTDTLNAKLELISATHSGSGTVSNDATAPGAGGIVDMTVNQLAPGQTFTITITARLLYTIQPNEQINNVGRVTYTSLPQNGTTPNNTGSTTPGGSGAPNGERDGSGTNPNDYVADSNTLSFTAGNVTAQKSIDSTSEGHTSDTQDGSAGNERPVAIGEVITYRLATTLPEGTSPNVQITDTLVPGIEFVSGSARISYVATNTMNFDYAGVLNETNPTFSFPAGRINFNAGTRLLTFDVGQVVNNDTDAGAEIVILEFNVVVMNEAANNIGHILTNEYNVTVNGGAPVTSNNVGVIVHEPVLTATKAVVGAPPTDALDPVSYDVVVTAGGAANQTTAFEVRLLDTLDVNLNLLSAAVTAQPAYATVTSNNTLGVGGTVDITLSELRPGDSFTVRIDAVVEVTVNPGQTIGNTATATWTSEPGSRGTGDSTPGNSGDVNGERTGSGGVNDLTTTTNTPQFTVNNVGPQKSIVSSSEDFTSDSTADTSADPRPVAVGEILRYRLVTSIPEGTSPNVFINDILVPGIEFIPGSARVSFLTDTPMTASPDFAGVTADLTPVFLFPASRISFNGGTRLLQFDLGTLVNNDGDADAERIVIEFNVLVANNSVNNIGQIWENFFEVVINAGAPVRSSSVFAQVAEPLLSVTKTAVPAALNPNNTVTYEIVVANPGGANVTPAFDVILTDILPAELTYVVGSAQHTAGVAPTTLDASGAPTIVAAWNRLNPGDSSTIRIQGRVNFTTLPGTVITNSAAATWTSLPGTQGTTTNPTGSATPGNSGDVDGERNGSGSANNDLTAASNADVTTLRPDITLTKSHLGNFTVGINGSFTLVVRNLGPGIVTDAITVTDTVPAELTLIAASGSGWNCGIVGQDVTCTYPAPVDVNVTLPAIAITVNPNTAAGSPFINTAAVSTTGDNTPGNNTSSDVVTVITGPEPDVRIVKSHAGDFFVGTNGAFTLRVQNVGAAPTTGVVTVTDNLPAELDFVSAVGSGWVCGYDTGTRTVTCTTAAAAAPGAFLPNITLTVNPNTAVGSPFTNAASVSTPGDNNPSNDNDTDDVIVNQSAAPDLIIEKTHTGNFSVGQNGSFTLIVRNIGGAPTADDITVTDTLPVELDFVSAVGAGWTCSYNGGTRTVTCFYDSLGPAAPVLVGGSLPPITLTVSPNTAIGSPFTNTVRTSTPGEVNTGNNADLDTVIVTAAAEPDLRVTKTHTGNFVLGVDGTFTLTAENVGSGPTTGGITVVDTLPAELTFVSATGTNWTCAEAPVGTLTCNYTGTPAAPGAALPLITVTVTPNTVTAPAAVTNVVTVATVGDTNVTNDADMDDVIIDGVPTPDLQVTKSHVGNFVAGVNNTFSLNVTNVGSGPTTGGITVVDTLPAELTFVSATGTNWTCAEAPAGTLTCNYTGVPAAPGTALPLITVTVTPNTLGGPFTNTAAVTTPGDVNPVNDTATDDVQIDAPIGRDLRITKSHVGNFALGGNGTYTLRVQNVGTSLLPAGITVTVTDTLPGTFTFVSASGTSWACAEAAGTVTCTLVTAAPVPVNSFLPDITLIVTPNVAGTFVNVAQVSVPGDGNTSNNTVDDRTQVDAAPLPDLAILKTHPTSFVVGSPNNPYAYTIVVTNVGSAPYTGTVRVVDTFDPAYVTFDSADGTDWTCAEAPVGTVTCDYIGAAIPLAPGTGLPLITLRVVAASAGSFDNIAVVTTTAGTAPDGNLSNDTSINPTNVNAASIFDPPLGFKVVNDAGLPLLEWAMFWVNPHPIAVTAFLMRVEDPIPAGTTYVIGSLTCTANNGSGNPAPNDTVTTACFYDAVNNMIVWEGRLAADPNSTGLNDPVNPAVNYLEIRYRTTLNAGVTSTTNTARAIYDANDNGTLSDELDPALNPPPNAPPASGPGMLAFLQGFPLNGIPIPVVPVQVQAVFSIPQTNNTAAAGAGSAGAPNAMPVITKVGDPFMVVSGGQVVWTIAVSNPRAAPVTNLVVSDTLPPQFQVVQATSTLGTVSVNGQQVILTVPTLNPGQTAQVVIRTTVRAAGFANQPAACLPDGPQVLENAACVEVGGQQVCTTAQVICANAASGLPNTGERSSSRLPLAAILMGLLSIGLLILRKRFAS
ncbi:MAG: isopeptide-forming domain-containing fimbrial protein [Anaerolineae bacterium]|nr:isopeptide-forming domain-containing fimbrial protein [Anaerolineae bacterium]